MKPHLLYARYVFRHKYFVLLAGIELGVPLWRLILHDWTKFLPREWIPYTNFFYGEDRKKETFVNGEKPSPQDFEIAWNHHQKKNDHHWQWWIRQGDDGTVLVLPMSEAARLEMLADWAGAGLALGNEFRWVDTLVWYNKNKHKMQLHPDTRDWVEMKLGFKSAIETGELG